MLDRLSDDDLRSLKIQIQNELYKRGISNHTLNIDMYDNAHYILLNKFPIQQGKRNDINGEVSGKNRYDKVSNMSGVSRSTIVIYEKCLELDKKYSELNYMEKFRNGDITSLKELLNMFNKHEINLVYIS